jgi:hypothetical protein
LQILGNDEAILDTTAQLCRQFQDGKEGVRSEIY